MSDWSTLSTNGRLAHHQVVSDDDIHGQTHAVRPHRTRKDGIFTLRYEALWTARTGGRSNGFRLRRPIGALSRQTDASPTIRWCLVMISMVKLMRYNCAAARRSFDANSDRTASASLELRSGRPVTVMVPAEAVSLRIKRLSQPPMMPYNE